VEKGESGDVAVNENRSQNLNSEAVDVK
jgi:hypothetical protein